MGNADVSSFPPLNTRPTKGCAPWPPFHQSYQQYTGFPYDGVEAATGLAGRERRPSSRSDGSNAPEEEVSNYRKVIPLPDEVKVNEGDGSVLVLFDQECVAQRFFESKWNKRGCVQLKLLQYRTTKRVRLIMIHEQVKKITFTNRSSLFDNLFVYIRIFGAITI